MADILNRLLLDTKDFDAKLGNSKKSVKDYQGGITSMAKVAGSGILKFAGAFGIAMGASEAFTKTINSSQTTGDAWNAMIGSAKTSVDEFFYSLATGDFSSFLNGLDGITSKARESIAALDQLGNTKISHGYFSAENNSKIADAQYTAKNKFAPIEDRTKSFENWRNALSSQEEINKTLQADLVKAITTSVEAEIGGNKLNVSMDDVRMALKIDVTNPLKREQLKNTYSEQYNQYMQAAKGANNLYQSFDKQGNIVYGSDKRKKDVVYRPSTEAEREKAISDLNNKYRDAIIVNAMLNKYKDDELVNIANMASEYQNLTSSLRSTSREYNETAMEFNNSNKTVKGFVPVQSLEGYKVYSGSAAGAQGVGVKSLAPVGSIAELNEEISAKNKELINATTVQSRAEIQKTINELEARKINLTISTNKELFKLEHGENKLEVIKEEKKFQQYKSVGDELTIKREELVTALTTNTTDEVRTQIQKAISDLEEKQIKIRVSLENDIRTNSFDTSSNKYISEYLTIENEIAKQNDLLINSTTQQASIAVQKTINELEARKINIEAEINVNSKGLNKEIAGITSSTNINNMKLPYFAGSKIPEFKSPISAKDISMLEDYQNEMYGVCDVMRFMSGITKDSEASWLNWGISLLQSIAQAIPAIRSLIPALAAKTAGEAASSAAQIPLVGWMAAGSAALSIISLFSSFPKFANGGIVSGRTLAEVGEYAGASSNPEVIAPLNKLKEYISPNDAGVENISFSAEYMLRGSDIYTSLTNYLKKTGKKI